MASWVHIFGMASLAGFVLAVISGLLIVLGGPDWWHSNPGGHFFTSLHLWSVEFFMAFMVVHLWAKFWMAAWRGGRARTWVTGVVAFVVSIVECFTGYLSQQNFDSQWIATNGKDAFNAAGAGGFWNIMNFGQMLLWHIALLPLVLLGAVGLHILLVRYRGVVHPFPARAGRDAVGRPADGERSRLSARELRAADASEWRGPLRRYDLIKEALDRINPKTMFVLGPLQAGAGHEPLVQGALATYDDASPKQQQAWAGAYAAAAATKVTFTPRGAPIVPAGRYGPVPELMYADAQLGPRWGP